jgi:serine/threonine-protein kinase
MTVPAIELGPDSRVGSYRIVREIASGGMGSVYEAHHSVLPRRAALKVMHPELRRLPGMASRMVHEAAVLEDIRHPGIARVFECNLLPDRRPWIAMELVEGETLMERLQHYGSIPPHEVCSLLAEVGDVLASVHARAIIHRDLKPDNLILTPCDRDYPLRVIDWGVARLGALGRLTLDGLTPGTPIYMSPEQATGRHVGPPSDVYSLGVIAYEVLTGHPPFDGRTLAEVVCMHMAGEPAPLHERTTAPRELCALVHRMLDKDPSLRPGAIEVRQVARAQALDAACGVETSRRMDRLAPVTSSPRARAVPSEEACVVDPEALELGVTQQVPVIRKPRWTPEIGYVPGGLSSGIPTLPKRR